MNERVIERVRGMTALEHMGRRKVLTPRQVRAGLRLAASYRSAVLGLRNRDGPDGPTSPSGPADAKIAASLDYDQARDLLGGRLWPVVWMVACDDRTVQQIAAERSENATATVTLLRLALDLLADRYGYPDAA